MPNNPGNLQKELDADINKVSGLLTAAGDDIGLIREALQLLKTSSNADFGETIVYKVIKKLEAALLNIEERTVHYEHQILSILRRIEHRLEPRFTIRITQESTMAIGNIPAGSTGAFAAQLEDNGSPITLPSGSTFAWSASDATVTFATSADTTSTVATVPAGDPGTSVTITASTTAPDGTTASGTITVALTPTPQQFSVSVTQTA